MDIHDNMHCINGCLSLVGAEGIIMRFANVWLADPAVAHDKSGMGSSRNDDKLGNSSVFPGTSYNWISQIK